MVVKKHNSFLTLLESKILSLSYTGRWFFSLFALVLIIGIIGTLISISNIFTTQLPESGGTYHEGIIGSPRFINPVFAFSDADHDLTSLVYNGLVRINEQGDIIDDLAQEWTVSDDGKLYTFTMKPDMVFHDKKPVTAYDVVFTIESIQNPLLKSPLRIAWTGINVSAPDAQTVIFELPKAYSGFLNQATVGILPSHLWKSFTTQEVWQASILNTEPVGSGAYKIKSIERNKTGIPLGYTLKAFNKFSLGKPLVSKIRLTSYANTNELVEAFLDKKIDGFVTTDMIQNRMENKSWMTVTEQSTPRVFSIFLGGDKNPLLKDTTVVRALKLAAPRQAIIDQVFQGSAQALTGPLPDFTETVFDDTKFALAKELLEKAGWKENPETGIRQKETAVLSFTFATANTPDLRKAAEIITEAYQSLGIGIDVQFYEIGTLQENVIRKRDFELLLFGQVLKHDTDLFAFWHSSQRTDPGLNIINYFSVRVDSLLDQALITNDRQERFAIYERINQELVNAPVIFLYAPQYRYVTDEQLMNVSIPPLAQPKDRFGMIHTWYLYTHRVWNWFLH
jgi:peptide/nickel transport system substrate-binding protein